MPDLSERRLDWRLESSSWALVWAWRSLGVGLLILCGHWSGIVVEWGVEMVGGEMRCCEGGLTWNRLRSLRRGCRDRSLR